MPDAGLRHKPNNRFGTLKVGPMVSDVNWVVVNVFSRILSSLFSHKFDEQIFLCDSRPSILFVVYFPAQSSIISHVM